MYASLLTMMVNIYGVLTKVLKPSVYFESVEVPN